VFANIVVALKSGLPQSPLLELTKRAAAPGARIHLVTLVKVETGGDVPSRMEAAQRDLDGAVGQLGPDYEVTSQVGIVVVAAAMDILAVAREREADLLVVGLAKRTRVGKALMGSDAQRVLIGASCPVLVKQMYSV
jgi:nucleotide-binding universal stress UspA family protein